MIVGAESLVQLHICNGLLLLCNDKLDTAATPVRVLERPNQTRPSSNGSWSWECLVSLAMIL